MAGIASRVAQRGVLTAVAALTVLGAGLRLYRLGHQSLWNDEIVTYISAAGTPWRVVTQRVENSNIPPLYYLVANASLSLGTPSGIETALRLPSVLVGALTIPLLFLVVRPWLGTRVALAAAACAAISPFHVWYSQEARPYALLLALALIAMACMQRAIRHPSSWRWKAATATALAATFYCHTVGLAFVLFAAAYIASEMWRWAPARSSLPGEPGQARRIAFRTQARAWIATFVGVAVLCIPAVYRLASFPPTNSADAERALSPMQLGYTLWSFVVGYSFGPSLGELHAADRHAVVARYAASVVPVALLIAGVMVWGAISLTRRNARVARIMALWFLFPLLFVIVGALVTVHPFNVRYAVISFIPVIVVLAVALDSLPRAAVRLAGWTGLVALSAVSLRAYYSDPRYARDDNRGAGQFFTAHAGREEIVVAHRAFTAKDFRFYAPPETTVFPYPAGDRPITSADVESDLGRLVHDAPRFWIFLSRSTPAETAPLLDYCDHRYRRDSAASFRSTGVDLIACVRGPATLTTTTSGS
jgi:hypothetical protein